VSTPPTAIHDPSIDLLDRELETYLRRIPAGPAREEDARCGSDGPARGARRSADLAAVAAERADAAIVSPFSPFSGGVWGVVGEFVLSIFSFSTRSLFEFVDRYRSLSPGYRAVSPCSMELRNYFSSENTLH
jgi:hypothetical protein